MSRKEPQPPPSPSSKPPPPPPPPRAPLTDAEMRLVDHVCRWGFADWPFSKVSRRWAWSFGEMRSPTLYATKREAKQAFSDHIDALIQRHHESMITRAFQALGVPSEALHESRHHDQLD